MELIQALMGLILWGSVEDKPMLNFMGTVLSFFSFINLLVCGFLGSLTECYAYENVSNLDQQAVFYGTISCYTNISFAGLNLITMILTSIFPPQFVDKVMQDSITEEVRRKRQEAAAREMKRAEKQFDPKVAMLNGPMRTGSVKKLEPMR